MRIERPARKRNYISLTPLIDVVFLLLVFFMLASTFLRYTGFDISGGRSGAVHSADVNDLVLVRVKGGSDIDVNGKPVELGQLRSELTSLSDGKKLKVAVKPVEDANVQDVVDVIEAARIDAVSEVMVVN